MSEVLAVLEFRDGSELITDTAAAIARVVGATVRVIDLGSDVGPALKVKHALADLAAAGTSFGVFAGAGSQQELGWHVAQLAEKPVVLVPRAGPDVPHVISRVLVPLDGTAESAAAVGETIRLLARAGIDIIVLHVFESATVPRFWDYPAHAEQVWRSEFLARYCDQPGIRFELRRGEPGENVLDVAVSERVDLIALAWSREGNKQAPTVRRAVRDGRVPVMLLPVPPTSEADLTTDRVEQHVPEEVTTILESLDRSLPKRLLVTGFWNLS